MMHSRKPHPARRLGEENFGDPGRDWGSDSHIFPGRRQGERNCLSWKKQIRRRQGLASCDEEICDRQSDNEPDHQQGVSALAVNKSLSATLDMMKSFSELIRVLEGIRSVANLNDLTKPNDRLLNSKSRKFEKVDDLDCEQQSVLALIDQLKVLGACQRIPSLNQGSEAQFYGDIIMPANDRAPTILLPKN